MARYFWRQLRVALLGSFLLACITQLHQTQASKPEEYTLEEASDELNYYSEWLTILANKAQNKEHLKVLSNEVEQLMDIISQLPETMKLDDKLKDDKQQKLQDFLRRAKANGSEHKLESASKMVALARSRMTLYGDMIQQCISVNAESSREALSKLTALKTLNQLFTKKYNVKHSGENWDKVEADVDNLKAAINATKEALLMLLKVEPSTAVDVTADLPVRVVPPPPTPVQAKVDITTELPVLVETPPPTASKKKVDITTELQARVVTPPTLPKSKASKPRCWNKTCGIIRNPYFYVTAPVVVITLTIGLAIFAGNIQNLPSAAVTGTIDSAFTTVAKGFSPLLAVVIILLVVAILTGGAFYCLDMQRQAGSKKKSTRKNRKKKSKTPGKSSKLTTQSPNQDSKLMKIQSTGKSSLLMSTTSPSTTSPSIALTKKTSKLKSPMVKNISKMAQFDVKTNKLAFKADSKLKSQQLDSSFWKDLGKKHSNMSQVSSKTSKQPTQVTTTRSSFAPTKAAKKLKKKSQSLVLVKKRTQSTSPSSSLTPKPTTTRRR